MQTKLTTFQSPRFIGRLVLADIEFIDSLEKIDQFAQNNGLEIFITSSARQQGVPIGGAIVRPASRSNHLVGHGIDMNIQLNGTLFNGSRLGNFSSLPPEIKAFITSIRNDPGLRWGGDFNDPVHIDDGLNLRAPSTWDTKFPIIQAELINLSESNSNPGEQRILRLTSPLMKGNDVLAVQKALIKLGFNIDDDGKFGSDTDAAVTEFQKSRGLEPDGRVGKNTREALGL
jgi:hypothetical protein